MAAVVFPESVEVYLLQGYLSCQLRKSCFTRAKNHDIVSMYAPPRLDYEEVSLRVRARTRTRVLAKRARTHAAAVSCSYVPTGPLCAHAL